MRRSVKENFSVTVTHVWSADPGWTATAENSWEVKQYSKVKVVGEKVFQAILSGR